MTARCSSTRRTNPIAVCVCVSDGVAFETNASAAGPRPLACPRGKRRRGLRGMLIVCKKRSLGQERWSQRKHARFNMITGASEKEMAVKKNQGFEFFGEDNERERESLHSTFQGARRNLLTNTKTKFQGNSTQSRAPPCFVFGRVPLNQCKDPFKLWLQNLTLEYA